METVFKEGQEVYDQVNFPDLKGKVIDVCNDESYEYPIGVLFENENGLHYYTPEGCFRKNYIPTLSKKPYKVELQGFEQKAPAPTYDYVRAESLKNGDYVSILNGIELPNERIAEAFEAFAKLIWLRDYYNEGCKQEDLGNIINAIIIERVDNEYQIVVRKHLTTRHVLFFKSEEIAFKFLEEQRELLEIAKPLL